jgi:hypothetical protein
MSANLSYLFILDSGVLFFAAIAAAVFTIGAYRALMENAYPSSSEEE